MKQTLPENMKRRKIIVRKSKKKKKKNQKKYLHGWKKIKKKPFNKKITTKKVYLNILIIFYHDDINIKYLNICLFFSSIKFEPKFYLRDQVLTHSDWFVDWLLPVCLYF